jgi:hypothetical protein
MTGRTLHIWGPKAAVPPANEPGSLDIMQRSKPYWEPYATCPPLLHSRWAAAGTLGARPGLARRAGPDGEQQ